MCIFTTQTPWIFSELNEGDVQGYKKISSGKEQAHRSEVGLILTKKAQRAMSSNNSVNDRIISANFPTVTGFVTVSNSMHQQPIS